MDDTAVLVATEQIKQLKARYFRFVDTKRWGDLEEQFTSDAVMDMTEASKDVPRDEQPPSVVITGSREIVDFIRANLETAESVHFGHCPEISVLEPDSAKGIWAMEDRLRWPESSPIRSLFGSGHYHETYVKEDGTWRIAFMTLTRTHVETVLATT